MVLFKVADQLLTRIQFAPAFRRFWYPVYLYTCFTDGSRPTCCILDATAPTSDDIFYRQSQIFAKKTIEKWIEYCRATRQAFRSLHKHTENRRICR